MTPKRRVINLSWFFTCLCVSKSLLIKCENLAVIFYSDPGETKKNHCETIQDN